MSGKGSIVVTGSSKGIGAAIVLELERRGYIVYGLSRGGESPGLHALACDVTDEQAVRVALADVAAQGPIAGLVNNAGVHIGGPTHRLPTADFEAVMTLNVTAVMICSREVFPYLDANGGGKIVNLGSFFDRIARCEKCRVQSIGFYDFSAPTIGANEIGDADRVYEHGDQDRSDTYPEMPCHAPLLGKKNGPQIVSLFL